MDTSNTIQAWPFVYTRNTASDYRFVLLPQIFAGNQEATRSLERELDGAPDMVHCASIAALAREYRIYFTLRDAVVDQVGIVDHVRRPVLVAEGYVVNGDLEPAAAERLIGELRNQSDGLVRIFWGVGELRPALAPPVLLEGFDPAKPGVPVPNVPPEPKPAGRDGAARSC